MQDARRQSSRKGMLGFKEEMAARIQALSDLVNGIEADAGAQDGRELEAEERKREALGHMDFRERQPLVEVMRECQMPVISENESGSRIIMDGQQIRAIRLSDHSNESPDLGPPPIARFDHEDPIKFNTAPVPETLQDVEEEEEMPASLSVNLETRRKRKDGQPKLELRRSSILPPPSPSQVDNENTSSSLRVGAKRKLADRDLDKPNRVPTKTDFTFSRKVAVDPAAAMETPVLKSLDDTPSIDMPPASPDQARKVLGDKSTNMSPRKQVAAGGKPAKDDVKKPAVSRPANRDRVTSRRSRLSPVHADPATVQHVVVPSTESHPHSTASEALPTTTEIRSITPAVDDLFSPASSELSARPAESRDTPPPGGFSNLTSSLAASGIEGARPSRRARAAVNYTEPSLIAKMRRPEKKMLDAVNGLQDHRRVMSASGERKSGSGRQVVIKMEPEDEDAWKDLPAALETAPTISPLTHKSANRSDDPALQHQLDSQLASELQPTTLANIQRLVQDKRMLQRDFPTQMPAQPSTAEAELDAASKQLEELDIYDFKDSSSPSSTMSSTSNGGAACTKMPVVKSHRRHSSIPKDMLSKPSPPAAAAKVVESSAETDGASRATRVSSRRRSMVV